MPYLIRKMGIHRPYVYLKVQDGSIFWKLDSKKATLFPKIQARKLARQEKAEYIKAEL